MNECQGLVFIAVSVMAGVIGCFSSLLTMSMTAVTLDFNDSA